MHELGIAESIVNIVLKECSNNRIAKVTTVGVRIGILSGVNSSALEFSFEAITADTPLSGASLRIEEIPASGTCRSCKKSFEVQECIFICPNCSSGDIEIQKGQELDIIYLETE